MSSDENNQAPMIGQPPRHVQMPVDTAINSADDDPLQGCPDVGLNSAEFPITSQPLVDTSFNLAEADPFQDSPDVEINPANSTPLTTLERPYEGMFFDTLKEAGDYYEDYGRQQGFSTRIRSSYKGKQRCDDVTSRLHVCWHEGKHEPNAHPETSIIEKPDVRNKGKRTGSTVKSGCPAHFRVTFDKYNVLADL